MLGNELSVTSHGQLRAIRGPQMLANCRCGDCLGLRGVAFRLRLVGLGDGPEAGRGPRARGAREGGGGDGLRELGPRHGVPRRRQGDTDIVPHHGRIQSGVSRRDCEERCRQQDTCHGFEFRSSERRCELWLQDIAAHVHDFYHRTVPGSPDFECIVKSPSCSELKAHKALHDAAASELSFFLEDYCEYGPTDEAFDVCSRSYDARRRGKCAGDEPPTLCGSHQEM
ncbi:unnamed protein product [Effrenium voratum]|nr:unnamed protein product [Effrenium voratum]